MMKIISVQQNGKVIALVDSNEVLITDLQSSLDLMATIRYETDSDRFVIHKAAINEQFFDLRTKLAGDILQKYINYQMKIAIVGDFSVYDSKSFKDFMFECNKGKDIFFLPTEEAAVEKLATV